VSKRCAEGAVVPWIIGIPLGFLLALIGPNFIHRRKPGPTNAPAAPSRRRPAGEPSPPERARAAILAVRVSDIR
jgi:hypothetical protein